MGVETDTDTDTAEQQTEIVVAELQTGSSALQKKKWQWNCGLVAAQYGKNSGSRIADKRQRTTKFLKVADQCEAEALFINSGPAEVDYGKNSGTHLWFSRPLPPQSPEMGNYFLKVTYVELVKISAKLSIAVHPWGYKH